MSNVKIRDSAHKAIERYLKASENENTLLDKELVETYILRLEEEWIRYTTAQDALDMVTGEENMHLQQKTRVQAENWYILAKAKFKKHFNLFPNPALPARPLEAVPSVAVKLPKMELPTFAGNPTEWISFRDIFVALIEKNQALIDSQRLHYLRSCLTGEALKLITRFEISNANYKEAWNLLKERYDITRIIVDHHLSAIHAVKKVTYDSSNAIKQVLDNIQQHVYALKALGRPVECWDDWLVHLVVSRLSFETRKQWELSIDGNYIPIFEDLEKFLQARCRSLETLNRIKSGNDKITTVFHALNADQQGPSDIRQQKCLFCSGKHKIYACNAFKQLSDIDKYQSITEKGACFNCLSVGHRREGCRSESACRMCKQRHHTILHRFFAQNQQQDSDVENATYMPQESDSSEMEASSLHTSSIKQVLLATVQARVLDQCGRWQPIRILLDGGSHTTLVTEACIQRLGICRERSAVMITCVGDAVGGRTRGKASLILSPRQSTDKYHITAHILQKITNNLPASKIKVENWPHVKNLDLADPLFAVPAPIDMLVGADEMDQFVRSEIRMGQPGTPYATLTAFGWALIGRVGKVNEHNVVSSFLCDSQVTKTVAKLWELDQFPEKTFLSLEETRCEVHFAATHQRDKRGRFIVKLPFKENIVIGNTRDMSERRFLQLEKRLERDSSLRSQYNKFMDELLHLGHMELAYGSAKNAYYMPHHAVIKNTSTTTKLRVVFDASAKSTSGYSLNDALMVGPQLQQDLFSILIRFRAHQFVLNADVEKMYRQVLVNENHVDYQRILWRASPADELKTYRLLRVTYGVASASYLAVKSMQQAAIDYKNTYVNSTNVILQDFYMDDLLTGADSENELSSLQKEISEILASGGFNLRKWASNSKLVTDGIPGTSKNVANFLAEDREVRALGLVWNTGDDYLSYTISPSYSAENLTKRKFLSEASLLFDPLGLLAPCIIKSKIWFQQLWKPEVNWDEPVPEKVGKEWHHHRKTLSEISSLKLYRWCGLKKTSSSGELHVFADASEKAYAAAIYCRSFTKEGVRVSLLAAKAKVAPLKKTTLPRLELCAALVAAKLVRQVSDSLQSWSCRKFAWTDSTITLAWLQDHPSRWPTFVANRVAAIQEVLPSEVWSHVASEHNPADCASRGMSGTELLNHGLWWNGPTFLTEHHDEWLMQPQTRGSEVIECGNQECFVQHVDVVSEWNLMTAFSSYSKLKRVVAYLLRFRHNVLCHTANNLHAVRRGLPTASELRGAEISIIRYSQELYFWPEIANLRQGKYIPLKSSLRRLNPFLDEHFLLRVGGRLNSVDAPFDFKNPIIVPKESALSKLIIAEIHTYALHAGPQMMQTILQRRFWIPGARNLVRKIYRRCTKCRILGRNAGQQMMANLPKGRLSYERCFLRSAVDCAGPYLIKFSAGRGAKSIKSYVCSFICMSTGAMHLELLSDLSASVFLHAFKRFINRRGYSHHVYSDNGTNFVGAERQIRAMFQQILDSSEVGSFLSSCNITWHFNPPTASHMGGYWESGIKRAKYHIKRALGATILTYEEFTTLLTEVEACVNSRPLCFHAVDPTESDILTPGHFLVGDVIKVMPEPNTDEFRGNLSQRWQLISAMRQHFWKRWREEYIVSLQKRTKWLRPKNNLKANDVVAIIGEKSLPTQWKLGKVICALPGEDGLVRVVTLKTADGECVRPVHKVCLLPTKDEIFAD